MTWAQVAAEFPRAVWLDGGERSGWDEPALALLEAGDTSISYDAGSRTVHRHVDGTSEVIGCDPFEALDAEMGSGEQWFGWFGYSARSDLPSSVRAGGVPDAVWMRPSRFEEVPAAARPSPAAAPKGTLDLPASYRHAFAQVGEELLAGNSYEVNLTTRFRATSRRTPGEVFERLRVSNPAPFLGLLQHDVEGHRGWLVSSSPERYLHVADRDLLTRPIKGTAPRGETPDQDERLRRDLAVDPKNRAENLMIADLLRHDVASVSEPGSVRVPELMVTESYASVHQLVTTVTGRLRPEFDALAATRSLFPAGSMTGAPKERTMQIIEAVETTPRGVYAGAFGMLSRQSADLAVVIRSATTTGDGVWEWGTGGGITVDSTLEAEWAELCWKSQLIARSLGQ